MSGESTLRLSGRQCTTSNGLQAPPSRCGSDLSCGLTGISFLEVARSSEGVRMTDEYGNGLDALKESLIWSKKLPRGLLS